MLPGSQDPGTRAGQTLRRAANRHVGGGNTTQEGRHVDDSKYHL